MLAGNSKWYTKLELIMALEKAKRKIMKKKIVCCLKCITKIKIGIMNKSKNKKYNRKS